LSREGGYEGLMAPDRGKFPVPPTACDRVLAGGKLKIVAGLEIIENSAPGRHGWGPVGPVIHKARLEGVATKDTPGALPGSP
jgi:hypothetical protein